MAQELNLKVTEERMADISLETFYFLDDGGPKAIIDFVAHFAVDENGEYMEKDSAVKAVISGRNLSDLEKIAETLRESIEVGIVPNG